MNYIIMADNHMAAFTDKIEADSHKHWMLQLFLSLDKPFEITVEGKLLNSHFLVIDKNVEHCFSSNKEVYFTMLIEPTSRVATDLTLKYIDNEKGYAIFDGINLNVIQYEYINFLKSKDSTSYLMLIDRLFNLFDVRAHTKSPFDDRVVKLFKLLDECDCSNHYIQTLADHLHLSSSRIAHLFKEQTGIPLKSYIVLHKLQKAYKFLLIDKKSITDAAMFAGFDSPSHLSYTNKLMTGMNLSNVLKDSEFLKVQSYRRV